MTEKSDLQNKNDVLGEIKTLREKISPEEHQRITMVLYRDGFRLMAFGFFVLLITFILYVILDKTTENKTQDIKYFAQKNDGRITPLIPLEQPNLNDKAILRWSVEAVPDIYSFDNVNYLKHFIRVTSQYFSRNGGVAMMEAMEKGVPSQKDYIMQNEFSVSTTLDGIPIIEKQGTYQDKYIWQVAIPVLISYSNVVKKSKPQKRVVRLIIERTPETDTDYGIEIVKFLMVSPKNKTTK